MISRSFATKSLNCGIFVSLLLGLAACGGGSGSGNFFGGTNNNVAVDGTRTEIDRSRLSRELYEESGGANGATTLTGLFRGSADPNITVEVNKYLWAASLDVLNFLPIESVDPFTGVIVTGYGTPPGGGRAYRATILVQDPALDARSLKLAMQTRGGAAVAPETIRAVEEAIMTRARQLRIQDGNL